MWITSEHKDDWTEIKRVHPRLRNKSALTRRLNRRSDLRLKGNKTIVKLQQQSDFLKKKKTETKTKETP